jgi:hypothetical protein
MLRPIDWQLLIGTIAKSLCPFQLKEMCFLCNRISNPLPLQPQNKRFCYATCTLKIWKEQSNSKVKPWFQFGGQKKRKAIIHTLLFSLFYFEKEVESK